LSIFLTVLRQITTSRTRRRLRRLPGPARFGSCPRGVPHGPRAQQREAPGQAGAVQKLLAARQV